jgi:AcrR family transcriptional regulator
MSFEPLTAERRRNQTRQYLLQAAAQVFTERGFHAASLDEVAAAAGFTKGAVYSNFKNKEDLMLALLEDSYSREMEALRQTLEASDIPPEARIDDFVSLFKNEGSHSPENWSTLNLEFTLYALRNPAARERLARLEREDIEAIATIIGAGRERQGIEGLEPAEDVARIIVALFHGIALMRTLDPDAVGEALIASAMHFVARGLGAGQ